MKSINKTINKVSICLSLFTQIKISKNINIISLTINFFLLLNNLQFYNEYKKTDNSQIFLDSFKKKIICQRKESLIENKKKIIKLFINWITFNPIVRNYNK